MRLLCKQSLFRVVACLVVQLITKNVIWAQESGASLIIGTQFPLQYAAGFQYQYNHRVSSYLLAGILTRPYDEYLIYSMEVSGLDKELSRIMRRSFEKGFLGTLGTNFHFNKYYVGIFGQFAQIQGKGHLLEMADIYYKGNLPPFDPILLSLAENLHMSWKSDLIDAGLIAGRRFILPKSKFEIRTEIGCTKIVGSKNKYSVGHAIIDEMPLAQTLYGQLNESFKEAYSKYGWIPSINLYLVYKLGGK